MNFPYYIKSYCEHLKIIDFFPNYSQILNTHTHTHTHTHSNYSGNIPERFPGGGHGNLLQYSGLENTMDRGA